MRCGLARPLVPEREHVRFKRPCTTAHFQLARTLAHSAEPPEEREEEEEEEEDHIARKRILQRILSQHVVPCVHIAVVGIGNHARENRSLLVGSPIVRFLAV